MEVSGAQEAFQDRSPSNPGERVRRYGMPEAYIRFLLRSQLLFGALVCRSRLVGSSIRKDAAEIPRKNY